MITAIVMVLIVVAVIAAVAWPLASTARSQTLMVSADVLAEWTAQRDMALKAIKDLEFDYQTGKVSAADYPVYDRRLREQALQAMHRLDTYLAEQRAAVLDTELEAEIAALHRPPGVSPGRNTAADLEQGLEAEIAALHRPPGVSPGRNTAADLEQGLEAEIAALHSVAPRPAAAAQRFCVQCGQALRPTDRFCGSCGAAV
ncbi:zinc ribbon domain-containing protein [Candidatus Amarolinea dominans]|uniref:zinc ribbon domain-containing protein n=1 Tax=Candidatus Amarolinea dominans TaxID=3140696 RepID=UPI001E052554|nr:zinc ribbon domain-containing protein [Anaerolineae bacterium]MBK9093851.1 zinc ribbon domain-containing protein [Anaerolineae bacterium]MBK9233764.1 zinc ribbon domain-containing protein [Anaerolineae bacterium]